MPLFIVTQVELITRRREIFLLNSKKVKVSSVRRRRINLCHNARRSRAFYALIALSFRPTRRNLGATIVAHIAQISRQARNDNGSDGQGYGGNSCTESAIHAHLCAIYLLKGTYAGRFGIFIFRIFGGRQDKVYSGNFGGPTHGERRTHPLAHLRRGH